MIPALDIALPSVPITALAERLASRGAYRIHHTVLVLAVVPYVVVKKLLGRQTVGVINFINSKRADKLNVTDQ